MKKLSIVIPAYNEEKLIADVLKKVISVPTENVGFEKEIIAIDDGSKDNTYKVLSSFKEVHALKQFPNAGKGRAVSLGVSKSTGDFVLIQDADLEYDPMDYLPLLEKLNQQIKPCAVYGSRMLGQMKHQSRFCLLKGKHPKQGLGPWLANIILSCTLFILYGKWLTDLLTAYKLYPGEFIRSQKLKTKGFETDHEITSYLLRSHHEIHEVPVSYNPRSAEEGKKIKAIDGLRAVHTLIKYRLAHVK